MGVYVSRMGGVQKPVHSILRPTDTHRAIQPSHATASLFSGRAYNFTRTYGDETSGGCTSWASPEIGLYQV
jgi:hypothetical protein